MTSTRKARELSPTRKVISFKWTSDSYYDLDGFWELSLSCGHTRKIRVRNFTYKLHGKVYKTCKCYKCGEERVKNGL